MVNMSADSIKQLLQVVISNAETTERKTAAGQLAEEIKKAGISFGLVDCGVLPALKEAVQNKKADTAREGAMFAYQEFCQHLGHPAEPYLVPELHSILAGYGDKQVDVRHAAQAAGEALFSLPGRFSVKLLVPILLENLSNEKKWQTKMAALQFLGQLTKTSSSQVQLCLPLIVPVVSDTMWATKPEVKTAATECMELVCGTLDNIDVVPFLPSLISCISRPEEVPECVFKLAATTFVQQVEAPTLAIMVPLLNRALGERKPATQRQTTVIIDNMCKLVENPADAHQFLPQLLPGLDRIIEIAADPELREVASNARATLIRVGGGGGGETEDPAAVKARHEKDHAETATLVKAAITKFAPKATLDEITLNYVASLIAVMFESRVLSLADWATSLSHYMSNLVGHENVKTVIKPVLDHFVELDKARQKESADYDPEEGEELCNCEFSLAYGGMILLNNTKLRLTRGQRYGLCGPNGVGKSTLMRAIANGQLDGFPPADELKTVFVEHTLQASEAELSVLDFCLHEKPYERDVVADTLASVGFDDFRRAQPVGSLSGGT